MELTGLTPFIIGMIRTPRDALATADPDKLAARYAIHPDHARFYLSHWIATL